MNVSVFINGQLLGSENRALINTGDVEPLMIGRGKDPDSYMSGKIDDFRIYDDVLSPLEISQLFAANDLYEELVEFQFEIAIEGSYDSVKVDGLPLGLGFDSKNLEVIGVPQEVGTFDLNISASNQAGTHQTTQRIIVEKRPKIASVKPRNLSSNGALATA